MLYVALRYETICQTVKKCENWKGKNQTTTTNCYKKKLKQYLRREKLSDVEGAYKLIEWRFFSFNIRDYNLDGQMVN